MSSQVPQENRRMPAPWPVLATAFCGAVAALAGGYWDDAWHTERGRDAFFIAPHVAIYGGIAAAGAALSGWLFLAVRTNGLRAAWENRPLGLALVAVGVTLASGPVDNAWHVAFGRDAVIWSPPHMLGIAGTLGLAAAILAEVAGRNDRWARAFGPVAGALVLAPAAFSVVEYDTDVPQFDTVFYLPVLGFAAAFALTLSRIASAAPLAATAAAAVHLTFVGAVGVLLVVLDFPPPGLPLLVAAAVVLDVGARRRWSVPVTAAAFASSLHLAYVPVRNALGEGVRFDLADVLLGWPLTTVAVAVVLGMATREAATGPRGRSAVGIAAAVLLVVAAPAFGHDPGQGADAGTVGLTAEVRDLRARVAARLPERLCRTAAPVAVVARRGGRTLRAPLTRTGCTLRGDIALPDRGRWFLYTRMRSDGRAIEAWLPVTAGEGSDRVSEPRRYAYVVADDTGGAVKTVGGGALYVAMFGLLYATLRLVAASRAPRSSV